MFRKKADPIDKEVEHILAKLSKLEPESKEYAMATDSLEVLCKARGVKNNRAISADTLLIVGGNLLGIVFILAYERFNVISSKALNLLLRGHL